MKEFMLNFRGYAYIWAESEGDAEKIFKRRFRKASLNGEIEHTDLSVYQDTEEKEQLWKRS